MEQPERSSSSKSMRPRSTAAGQDQAMGDLLAAQARRYSSSASLSMKSIQSPDLASHRAAQLQDMVERGRKAKAHDRLWERSLAGIGAHKQRMSGQPAC